MLLLKDRKKFQFYPHLKNDDAVELFMDNSLEKDFFKQGQPVSFKYDGDEMWNEDSILGVGILFFELGNRQWVLLNDFYGADVTKDSTAWRKYRLKYKRILYRSDIRDILTEGIAYEFAEMNQITQKEFDTANKMLRTLTFLGFEVMTDGKMYHFGCGSVKLSAETIETAYRTVKAIPKRDLSKLREANEALVQNAYDNRNLFRISDAQFRELLGKKSKK